MLSIPHPNARKHLLVRGIVQGVGFRPFVYRLAQTLALTGYVLNSPEGVVIEIEGECAALEGFLHQLRSAPPPLAYIEEVAVTDLEPTGYDRFDIRQSLTQSEPFVLVSPDVATCEECLRDCSEVHNRRYGYPFSNCTACGPRYTIIRELPYDRPLTTMATFPMCPACLSEYHDPSDRRFHAQPNACPDCGPALALVPSGTSIIDEQLLFAMRESTLAILSKTHQVLHDGAIVALKGLGGFHLACDATNDTAVQRLRERKRRNDKPFALMVRDLAMVECLCFVSDADRRALTHPRRPIVIMPRRSDAMIAPTVAPDNATLGIMLPYTPLHHLLFGSSARTPSTFAALVMTSGNQREEPIVTTNAEACEQLRHIADWFLLHNRDIHTRVDDSIVRTFHGHETVLRRSRGYAPYPILFERPVVELLACGPELKHTFCLTRDRYAFVSQHLGDLANYETLAFFHETLERMRKLFRIEPRVVAHDLHPSYLSTRFALAYDGAEKVGVQHHHAHIASCMAENRLHGQVIGVAFDGTGYGTDGQMWGGEFLVADYKSFVRCAHFRYVGLPGGDTAIREPWRMALSYLWDTFGGHVDALDLPWSPEVTHQRLAVVQTMLRRGINTIQTSSCGRLFDAVASLIGVQHAITFEGQAAIALEMTACEESDARYPFVIEPSEPWQIDVRPMIEGIIRDLQRGQRPSVIAAAFHNTLAAIIIDVCRRLRDSEGLPRVCLSGGVFHNMLLLRRTVSGLSRYGFVVYLHHEVPPNDGGIALGQAVIANAVVNI